MICPNPHLTALGIGVILENLRSRGRVHEIIKKILFHDQALLAPAPLLSVHF
jgi:hypothetical protein